MGDNVNSPDHYAPHRKMESIDILREFLGDDRFEAFCLGACLKYLYRYRDKGKPHEDLEKARWFLNEIIFSMEESGIGPTELPVSHQSGFNLDDEEVQELGEQLYRKLFEKTYDPCMPTTACDDSCKMGA